MTPDSVEDRVRAAMFEHLAGLSGDKPAGLSGESPAGLKSVDLNCFEFDGRQVGLVVQPGIRKPHVLAAALTIRTTARFARPWCAASRWPTS